MLGLSLRGAERRSNLVRISTTDEIATPALRARNDKNIFRIACSNMKLGEAHLAVTQGGVRKRKPRSAPKRGLYFFKEREPGRRSWCRSRPDGRRTGSLQQRAQRKTLEPIGRQSRSPVHNLQPATPASAGYQNNLSPPAAPGVHFPLFNRHTPCPGARQGSTRPRSSGSQRSASRKYRSVPSSATRTASPSIHGRKASGSIAGRAGPAGRNRSPKRSSGAPPTRTTPVCRRNCFT